MFSTIPEGLSIIFSYLFRLNGTVYDMKSTKENDGDCQFTLDVEQPYKKLLNDQNNSHASGRLLVEIIPRDQNILAVQIPMNGGTE